MGNGTHKLASRDRVRERSAGSEWGGTHKLASKDRVKEMSADGKWYE